MYGAKVSLVFSAKIMLHLLNINRRDLKVVVTSATIDPAKFCLFFNGCPTIGIIYI